ncbi:bifunctional diaminohydroxyphosphoribosylaminopyrimidine deaminase/5-amino-6-(5-phosphoribosylamino)uracil reductase RibD [Allobranchiibius sp. GilTou73]|uniref:bifunctional diaminohydroxyphosphoribosylaminopyrimidine deaminase/5-amino-6-(5-phosphoribosylamino)uracil reductase RibD n=1 Tax=Allobranchiibius sp. GilTou73 TaxID=2904523 RepID=UPI001F0153FE|nr:bifunctional diaminohydroxyphosphoribosylaminopyrimidine deaminase/5-amino-6-(5-phosphoribosylamino)uracil reductase RibD [Allobranchiibius sp. GilTou73]UIJ34134.1 bifunctional diaminohydroxyphosphoribosylaminopyrimidine deaminase/5-amino-6-(5-phosphoribosylamino)uracil reductase RibD [Allobranchiibius sp. GilTou73]
MDTRSRDETFLLRALELAQRGPAVDANPRVGCVVVAGDSVVGEGWHDGAGTAHAEVMALGAAGDRARGATAYVTLEPCAHVGRTGPCAEALVEAGVRRVVYAQSDPNPAARGGAAVLRDADVELSGGLRAAEAAALNAHWTFAVEHERPYVTWKFAATLDGRSAAADGSSRWITGAQARADVHRLRAGAGALVVGTGTVLADDPALTVRTPDAPRRPPLRVIVGEREIPATARVLDDAAPTLLLPVHDPHVVLKQLHAQEIRHVWLEGGPTLAAAFLRTGLVDEVVAYLAPALLGDGPAAVAGLGIGSIDGIRRFGLSEVTRLGDDLRLRLQPTTTTKED